MRWRRDSERGAIEELKGAIRSGFTIHMQLLIENTIDVDDQVDLLDMIRPFWNNSFVLFWNGEVDILLNARRFIPIVLSE